ncbi:acetylserotonin O-methyltransferase [Mycobacterium sp. IDR2000157661]|uniref:acetylserotonin O-methyltransferase n=1 Tax=Mycobacterium sp. IDR2000157661 TaxID=2867005 RepID=UPI001EEF4A82|nr:acetylserotonin O-methyltransferase [Mycobacterium sp. IDR2000157661]ULE35921.1 hydroxyneurosporene methyltransferase [Mycobacterium sp. IDR2000157661]
MFVVRAVGRLRAGLQSAHRSTVPPSVAVLEMATGAWTTQTMYVAAKLGIADELADGAARAADIAPRVGADPDALYRLMRALASKGLLRHRRNGSFALTKVGQALRSDVPGSMRDMILFVGHRARWEDWGNLLHSVQTGEPSVLKLRGMPYWDYLETDRELAQVFNAAMTATSGMTNEIALAAYDFTDFKLVVDVGGGQGRLLSTILHRAPGARGLLYDLPAVVAGADPVFAAAGVADRCTAEGGSFLERVPGGGDAYVMKNIIHDWDDESSLTILRNIRTAITPQGKLLMLEMVLPERTTPFVGYQLDLEMLVTVGGRERTRAEYSELLSRAGFRLDRVVETVTPVSIVEASPV